MYIIPITTQKKLRESVKDEQKQVKKLERELVRKDKALAEAAALPPPNKLSEDERSKILESTFYAILRLVDELHHRGRAKARKPRKKPDYYVQRGGPGKYAIGIKKTWYY